MIPRDRSTMSRFNHKPLAGAIAAARYSYRQKAAPPEKPAREPANA
jgi:hypothetical protein